MLDSDLRPTRSVPITKATQRRREARVHALQLAYAWDLKKNDDGHLAVSDESVSEQGVTQGREIFQGMIENLTPIDAILSERLANWSISRLTTIDRSILRLGVYELCYREKTPTAAIINEYIEITKMFGSEAKTAGLVNGVLDRVARDTRTRQADPALEAPGATDVPPPL